MKHESGMLIGVTVGCLFGVLVLGYIFGAYRIRRQNKRKAGEPLSVKQDLKDVGNILLRAGTGLKEGLVIIGVVRPRMKEEKEVEGESRV